MKLYEPTYRNNTTERIGDYDVLIPDIPDRHYIMFNDRPQHKQKWEREDEPYEFDHMTVEEKKKHAFVQKQFHRRKHGVWFFNNGEPTYITGRHYTYLQWWKLDSGKYPEYRDSDRMFFLVWDHCHYDRNCLGLIYFKNRREGATARAGFLNFEITSRIRNAIGGIQSKNDSDARDVFSNHVVKPIKSLPDWLRPIQSGLDQPGQEIRFYEPSSILSRKKATKGKRTATGSNALDSLIGYRSSKEEAYDSQRLTFYHCDEFGKLDRVDAVKRHRIVKPCLMEGQRIIGKALYTSTVEDIGAKALHNALQLWNQSDPNNKDKYGRTVSGLYRYFKPAYYGLAGFIDDYGRSQVEEAKEWIMSERQRLKEMGDMEGWAEFVRKYPISDDEPFTPNASDCLFDLGRLQSRKQDLLTMQQIGEAPTMRGDLVWVEGEMGGRTDENDPRCKVGQVTFIPNPTGRFERAFPPIAPNNVQGNIHGTLSPGNTGIYSAGIDPYDFSQTVDNRGSKGAGAVFINSNPIDPDGSDRWAMIYHHRPATNTEFYEDMVKMLHYYGCPAVVERNKVMCKNYIFARGLGNFVMNKLRLDPTKKYSEQGERGEYTKNPQLVSITDALATYIYESVDKIDFIPLLDELMTWNISNSNSHDIVIAGGYSLLASKYHKLATSGKITEQQRQVAKVFFPVYKYNGNNSAQA